MAARSAVGTSGAKETRGQFCALSHLPQWWQESVAEPVLSVLFPPRCVGCGDFESHLCASCREALDAIDPDCCPRCGEPGPAPLVRGRCRQCMGKELPYAGARAAFRHHGVARRLVADFKFGGQPALGRVMADVARPAFREFASHVAPDDRIVVTWVPSHRKVQRQRGYNQAELLARHLASDPRPLTRASLVRKTVPTKDQKGLGRAGRQDNLQGVFSLDERGVAGLSPWVEAVIVVDDVYTTGATAKEVSSVLVGGIGLPVHVFTFSRAVAGSAEGHD
ncbi:MAG: ComF family protein [Thermoleophilia bacterium]|nr:ComF family protein [Thermoleophilia bacterium]